MRTFRRLLLFLLLLVALDFVLGLTLARLYRHVYTGETGGQINQALTQQPQVLLLGSSRMKHHVMPAVLAKSLALSAFNAGIDGHDFLYAAMLFELWKQTNPPPKMILLNVDADTFARRQDEIEKTKVFSFYYDRAPLVREILSLRSPFEPLKFLSYAYRANGQVFPILKNLAQHPAPGADGFEPLRGDLSKRAPDSFSAPVAVVPTYSYWDLKLRCFDGLVSYCRRHEARLFLITTPRYGEDPSAHVTWTRQLADYLRAYPEVEFVDVSAATFPGIFAGHPNLFSDRSHLNAQGARQYSELLADALATRLAAGPVRLVPAPPDQFLGQQSGNRSDNQGLSTLTR